MFFLPLTEEGGGREVDPVKIEQNSKWTLNQPPCKEVYPPIKRPHFSSAFGAIIIRNM